MIWRKVKLKEVLKQYRIDLIVQDRTEYKQVTISKHNGVNFRGYKKGKDIGRKRQFLIDLIKYPNTLMFVRQGVEDGSIGIAPKDVDGCIATENMPMFSIENIETDFLRLLIKSSFFKNEVAKISTTGSAQKSIHERQLLEIEIPLPSTDEQKYIVKKYLTESDISLKLNAELDQQHEFVKKLRQALLGEAIQGKLLSQNSNDEPASELLKKIKAAKEQLVNQGKLKKENTLPPIKAEEIPFKIPICWVWCRLGDIAYITSGSTPSQDAFVETGIPYLKMYNLRNQKIDFYYKPQYIKEDVHNGQLKRCRAYPGDILMNIVGPPLGKIAIIPDDLHQCNFNQAAVLIRPFVKEMNSYIFWYLNEMTEINSIDTKGVAGQNNISVTQAHNMKIPLPPLSEQHRIIERIDQLMSISSELEHNILLNQKYTQQLMQVALKEALSE